MTDLRFYHLTATSVEQALPLMLSKTLERGKRAQLRFVTAERLEAVNQHLWTYEQASFLPHGGPKQGRAEAQPIWLTLDDDNPNQAEYLFLLEGRAPDVLQGYEMVALLFDARDEVAMAAARQHWKTLSQDQHLRAGLSYWRQTPQGGWDKQR